MRWAERIIFHENLREFGVRVGLLCALEEGNKLSQEEAYKKIRKLWKKLKKSKKNLID